MSKTISTLYKNIETYPKKIGLLSLSTLKNLQQKKWYVRFRFYDERDNKWKLVIRKPNVNRKDLSLAERKAQLTALKDAVEFKLKVQQWNPLTNTYIDPEKQSSKETEIEVLRQMFFFDALDYAVSHKTNDWSKKTRQDYKSFVKYLKQAASSLGLLYKTISEVRRLDCRLLLQEAQDIRKLTNIGYNKYRDFLSSLLGTLEEFEILEYNPVHKIKQKATIKKISHRPPTSEQKKIIFSKIKCHNKTYYRFLAVLYGCTLRPKEITRLKIKHLIRASQIFRIIPDRIEENSKTLIEREVVIPDWVLALLDELHLERYDQNWYIFSTRNKYGSFMPGPNRMHSNTPTTWWRKIVKEDLGLDVTQYSLKKLSGNHMVRLLYNERANDLIKLPQRQMGHATSEMTEVYVDEHIAIENEIVRRKMPVL
jgi:integrase